MSNQHREGDLGLLKTSYADLLYIRCFLEMLTKSEPHNIL